MRKNMRFTIMTTILLILGVGVQNKINAQEWSASQKEVWKGVNDYWAVFAKGDVAGFLEYFHPDYMGWDDNSPLPSTKPEIQKWLQLYMSGRKVLDYEIKPVGIKVYGDFAFADYYSTLSDVDGKKKMEEGRWTDILMKQGGKWLIVGDNGGTNEKKHED